MSNCVYHGSIVLFPGVLSIHGVIASGRRSSKKKSKRSKSSGKKRATETETGSKTGAGALLVANSLVGSSMLVVSGTNTNTRSSSTSITSTAVKKLLAEKKRLQVRACFSYVILFSPRISCALCVVDCVVDESMDVIRDVSIVNVALSVDVSVECVIEDSMDV